MADERDADRPKLRQLPGSRSLTLPEGMHRFLVLLDSGGGEPQSRAEIVDSGKQRAEQFREAFLSRVATSENPEGVNYVGDPTAIGFVEIVCTPEAAKLARELPGVDSVVEDDDASMGIPF